MAYPSPVFASWKPASAENARQIEEITELKQVAQEISETYVFDGPFLFDQSTVQYFVMAHFEAWESLEYAKP